MRWIKNRAKRIWTKIENHLIRYIAWFILAALISMCYVFWEWLKSIHTFELLGFYWILIFLVISLTPILLVLVFQFFKKQFIYKEEGSIKTVLKENLRRLTDGDKLHEIIDYRNWDRELNIKKGGTKRYFKTVLSEFDVWSIDDEGEDIICIGRDIPEAQCLTE